jgi:hypothetical protein
MAGDREKRLRQLREAYESGNLDEGAYHVSLAAALGVQIETGGGSYIGGDVTTGDDGLELCV